MILKALYDFYERYNSYNREAPLPPVGFEEREIGYYVIINQDGIFQRFQSLIDENDRGPEKLVMQYVERTSNAASMPNRFWDGIKYVLNMDNGRVCKAPLEHCQSFARMVKQISELYPQNVGFRAVSQFYEKKEYLNEKIVKDCFYNEISKTTKNVSFCLLGENECVASHPDLFLYRDYLLGGWSDHARCIVTGNYGPVVKTASIVQIPGGDSKGKLVSFNDASFNSHGFNQMENAPLSIEADSKIYNACKQLMKFGSDTAFSINNRTYLFWTSENSRESENVLSQFHDIGSIKGINTEGWTWDISIDNPEEDVYIVKNSFLSMLSGKGVLENNASFYMLGLTTNSSRDVVVCWKDQPLVSLCRNLQSHFNDMQIYCASEDKPKGIGLYSILDAISVEKKDGKKDFPDNESEKILMSIIDGKPYPYTMYLACLNRIRHDIIQSDGTSLHKWRQRETIRTAIIRGFLHRYYPQLKMNIMLNEKETNPGYVCGRLFAVLERVQELSNRDNGFKSTLRSRYFSMASIAPADIFVNLINLSTHHHDKLDNDGWLYKLEEEIIGKLPSSGFPLRLSLIDQGAFVIGYYHQKQSFVQKKNNNE